MAECCDRRAVCNCVPSRRGEAAWIAAFVQWPNAVPQKNQVAQHDGFSIGVDLGGTNLRMGAYNRELERLNAISIRTRLADGPHAVLRDMAGAIAALRRECASHGECAGVGVGSPGPLELPHGKLLGPANLPGWDGLELKAELEKLLDLPVTVDSDANVAALAEWRLGAGRTHAVDSMAMFTLGTGVGGGLILKGKLWHGARGMAAEPGHTVVFPDGLPCNCGSRGCLEMYASATAVQRRSREEAAKVGGERLQRLLQEKGDLQAHDVAELARGGDAAAREIFAEAGDALGCALAAWVSALNLPLYTLGGGMAQAWDLFAPAMFQSLRAASQTYRLTAPQDVGRFESGKTNVLPAQLGPDAGLAGAALLPFAEAS
jgi:glucokinase